MVRYAPRPAPPRSTRDPGRMPPRHAAGTQRDVREMGACTLHGEDVPSTTPPPPPSREAAFKIFTLAFTTRFQTRGRSNAYQNGSTAYPRTPHACLRTAARAYPHTLDDHTCYVTYVTDVTTYASLSGPRRLRTEAMNEAIQRRCVGCVCTKSANLACSRLSAPRPRPPARQGNLAVFIYGAHSRQQP